MTILNTTIEAMVAEAAKMVTVEEMFRAAYEEVKQAGGRASLSDMRAQMSLSRAEFDEGILKLEDDRKATLYDLDDPAERTPEIMAGGVEVVPGLLSRQVVYMK